MNRKRVLEYLGIEIVFTAICVMYMIFLYLFNQKLFNYGLAGDTFSLIKFENYKAIKYFVGAVVLYFVGLWRAVSHGKAIAHSYLETNEMIMSLIAITVIILLLVGIFILINNPILRAIIAIGVLSYVLFSSLT